MRIYLAKETILKERRIDRIVPHDMISKCVSGGFDVVHRGGQRHIKDIDAKNVDKRLFELHHKLRCSRVHVLVTLVAVNKDHMGIWDTVFDEIVNVFDRHFL